MSVIYLMIPAAFLLTGLGVYAFIRCVKAGQMDDLDTPPIRAILDETPISHR